MINITENGCIKEKSAVALGIFDGVHIGHREIIKKAVGYSDNGFVSAVFTFNVESIGEKHSKKYEYIYTNEQKFRRLEDLGIEYVMSPDFENIKELSGEEFACELLCKSMNAKTVICGENFRFGRAACCGIKELEIFGEKYGFNVDVIKLSAYNGKPFSSEEYRRLLKDGKVYDIYINGMDFYSLYAEVVTGNRLGRTIDFPTINQTFGERQLIPKNGVYHTFTIIDGKTYNSVTNIGVKPTVEKDIKPLAETHILDFNGDLYGKKVEVRFYDYVRSEKKFGSLDELKKQINADIDYIRNQNVNVAMQKPI